MAGKSPKERLDANIVCLKWTVCSFNVLAWMIGVSIFALSIWLKVDPGFSEWITLLELQKLYAGVYVLMFAAILVMIVSFAGCFSALMESTGILLIFIGTQVLGFILGLAGSAVFLDYSTSGSKLEPLIRDAMRRLIMDSYSPKSAATLRLIQEGVGCCGGDGPHDYLWLRQPLPTECRDSVTGNTFFYGCVDEITWFFEEKAGWVVGLSLALCAIHVINVALCAVLVQALKKEDALNSDYIYKPVAASKRSI